MQVTLPYVLNGTIRGTKGPDRIGLGVEVKTYKRSNDLSSVASRPVRQPSATAFMIGGERDTAHDWLGAARFRARRQGLGQSQTAHWMSGIHGVEEATRKILFVRRLNQAEVRVGTLH